MKILVIGGSYFLGRVFIMLASKEHEITVVNRGSQSLAGLGVKEIHGDRHDADTWHKCEDVYDVVVDFCGYQAGDIKMILEQIKHPIKQYIFISTVDALSHNNCALEVDEQMKTALEHGAAVRIGEHCYRKENYPLEDKQYPGEIGDYIMGKVELEKELVRECGQRQIPYTILRPSIIYGPMNYAPREAVFIQCMASKHVLPCITEAKGKFQFVYVKDVAYAIINCLGNEKSYGQSYHLCGEETVDYQLLSTVLKEAAAEPVQELYITAEQAQNQGFPLPFPVNSEETHLCDNEKSKNELGIQYTPLVDGMKKTCNAFWNIYSVSS